MKAVACKYYVQNEKLSSFSDLFVLPKKFQSEKEVKVKDIYSSFPLKDFNYYLRFETNLSGNKIWADIPNMDSSVPFINGLVHIKALKLPENVNPKSVSINSVNKVPKQESGKVLNDILLIDEPVKREPKTLTATNAPVSLIDNSVKGQLKMDEGKFVPSLPSKNVYKSYEENVKEKVND